MLLDLQRLHVVVPVGCDDVGSGESVGGCNATSEPVTEPSVSLSSCGMAGCCTTIAISTSLELLLLLRLLL
jgi:hypothetical protein